LSPADLRVLVWFAACPEHGTEIDRSTKFGITTVHQTAPPGTFSGCKTTRHLEHDMDSEDIQRHRPRWAVLFSATMHTLNPGVRLLLQWLRLIAVLIAIWQAPDAVSSWLG
jgi:hypothetical protein